MKFKHRTTQSLVLKDAKSQAKATQSLTQPVSGVPWAS
jgi:hypothetical protein